MNGEYAEDAGKINWAIAALFGLCLEFWVIVGVLFAYLVV
jgi:hypothetical protein